MRKVKKISQDIISLLQRGGVIAYPTDTAYGLGASANSLKGINKVFAVKRREKNKPISVVVASLKQAREIAEFSKPASKLWRKFMPGALTLRLPLTASAKKKKVWRLLGGGSQTLGLRLPNHPWPVAIAKRIKAPLTTTSANVSGLPSAYSAEEVESQFKNNRHKPDIIIDGGKLRKGRISTVVDCAGEEVKILREGSISRKQIFAALKK